MPRCTRCGEALPAGARFCPACSAPVTQSAEPAEERKVATVLFADLVGSTALAGAEDPERTRVVLDRFYDAMAAEIERAGGTVEHFAGDAVMAAFGAPQALEDHPERALHAALAMQARLQEEFGERLSMRIGINTGEVVLGRARAGSSFVSGDVVNVGARLEQAAGAGEILVGERTATAVRGAFELSEPKKVEAKGKPDGVSARRLIRALSLMRPRGVGELHTVFVGRERELDALRAAYDDVVSARTPRLVLITGDAGVGKTRLVRELWAWLAARQPQPLQRTGRCLSYGNASTYFALAEVLKEHFGLFEADAPAVVAEKLGERSHLGLTLGLNIDESLHPLVARERLHDAWVSLLSDLVAEQSGVLLIEDVHWADDELLDLLDLLVAQVEGPLLVLATARPELLNRRSSWQGQTARRSCVALDALQEGDAGELLRALLGQEPPVAIQQAIVAHSEGNPFFVEELLSTLIDRGVLSRRNGGWSFAELPQGFAVPDTVQAVLAARIDLLPEMEKEALQAGALIGRVFWSGPVYELLDGAMPDFGLLEERDFVRRRAGSSLAGEREYAIKHALTREVAYASLPKARRARLHARFADWLEQLTHDGDEHAALVAHHYGEAVRPEDNDLAWPGQADEIGRLRLKARDWSLRAGRLAVARYEMDTGIALLRHAADFEPADDGRAQIWLEIGQANAIKYDGSAFLEAMERALELGAPPGAVYAEMAYADVQRGAMWNPGIGDLATEWVSKALASTTDGTPEHAKALAADASLNNRPESARRAIAWADASGDDHLRSAALFTLTEACYRLGDLEAMYAAVQDNLALLPRITDPDRRANIYVQASTFPSVLGRFEECFKAAERLADVTSGLTPHHRVHAVGPRLGLRFDMGLWSEICELMPDAEAVVDANRDTPCVINITALLFGAFAHEIEGQPTESRRLEEKAESLGISGYDQFLDPLRVGLAVVRKDLRRVRELMSGIDPNDLKDPWDRLWLLDGLMALGDLEQLESQAAALVMPGTYFEPFALRSLGIARADPKLLDQAITRFQAMGMRWHAAQTRSMAAGTA